MRKITLKPTEFFRFREMAQKIRLFFDSEFVKGMYIVEADSERLEQLGY